jgi:multicomponent Na+:H+ antiporter subunit C
VITEDVLAAASIGTEDVLAESSIVSEDVLAASSVVTVNATMAIVIGGLYGVGFYLLLQRSLMRVLIGVVVLGHASNLLLQLAGGPPGRAPIVGEVPADAITDPLPQALALTAVVITFALTTFLLALGYRSFVLLGHDEVQDDLEDRRIARQTAPAGGLEEEAQAEESPGGRDAERADDAVEGEAAGAAGGRR